MRFVSLPSDLADAVGPIDGVEILTWDMQESPPRDDIELVMIPSHRAPWIKRLDELPALKAVQIGSAGHDSAVKYIPAGVTLSNAVGVHDTATAELALTLMLASQRGIPEFVRSGDRGEWLAPRQYRSVADARVVIVGYGGIGRALAARLKAAEADVVAVASKPRAGDDLVDEVHGVSDLRGLVADADVLALAVPLTEATRHVVDADLMAALPDGALIVNVGRGGLVDTEALLPELQAGRLRLAADVTAPEPLPEGHPLWSAPGVLISPHVGSDTPALAPRMLRFVRSQLTAFGQSGELPHTVAVGV